MPLVQIKRDPTVISDEVVKKLAEKMPAYVATVLRMGDGEAGGNLQPIDVEVCVLDHRPFDVNTKPLQVMV